MSTPLTRGQVQNRLTRLSNSTKYAAAPCHGYIAELADTDADLRQQLTQAQARIDMLEAEAGYHGAKDAIEQLQQQLATAQTEIANRAFSEEEYRKQLATAQDRVQTLKAALKPFVGVYQTFQAGTPFKDAVALLYSCDFYQAQQALATPAAEQEEK